ncbi:cyanide-forming glycine dehydrogenase subunit HcnB [Pseudomonas sp. 6D_7.1_Bac1]|uniref:cyanide-forming glycine dehydrogenase subunit HcnB n=1 Tax=Pseudomonas sp. 6D_7.1_Bac1 TaxID=2971615 RepID=UPI0021C9D18A|nr:cyanide-forming glycine dehydrogenase subunit HcnB [Pseudomonas sp. 6D_7.1_Bac1]MCU1750298.1 cyanide-forming glycine dehydrogenase subunit HcnB [Pseudomonas sp. 6D_7.1_Bac1]
MSLHPVIVGGGPAGMAAAIELAEHGVHCTLLEEASRLGGVVYRGPLRDGVQLDYLGPRYAEDLARLHGDFQDRCALIDVCLNTRVIGAQGTRALVMLDADEHVQEITYPQLLLAAGCHERSVPFPGWTLPGVILLGGLQLQIKSGVVKPQSPVVIAGTGPLLPLVACQLHASGVKVAGVFEACAFGKIAKESLALLNKPQLFLDGLSMLAYLKLHRIPMRYGWGVVEAQGEGELRSVTVAPYSSSWQPDLSRAEQVAAQTLAVGYGFIPRTQLSQQMGLEHGFSDDGYLRATANIWQQSSEPHIHLAGDMGGIRGGEAAMLSGRIAALSILVQRDVLSTELALHLRNGYLAKLKSIVRFRAAVDRYTERGAGQTALPAADTVICRCEKATRADIDRALSQGVQDMASLKMRTRVSMGDCQGRMCVGYCSDRLREATGRPDVGWLRPRFPIDPIPFSAFQNLGTDALNHE